MMAAILSKQYGAITVVTDSITSTGLNDFISSSAAVITASSAVTATL